MDEYKGYSRSWDNVAPSAPAELDRNWGQRLSSAEHSLANTACIRLPLLPVDIGQKIAISKCHRRRDVERFTLLGTSPPLIQTASIQRCVQLFPLESLIFAETRMRDETCFLAIIGSLLGISTLRTRDCNGLLCGCDADAVRKFPSFYLSDLRNFTGNWAPGMKPSCESELWFKFQQESEFYAELSDQSFELWILTICITHWGIGLKVQN